MPHEAGYDSFLSGFGQYLSSICLFLRLCRNYDNREFMKTATVQTATGTSLNKRFNEQNYGCARAL